MNLGLDNATGKFAYFLNAGDQLHAPDVLAKVAHKLENKNATWLFGPVGITNLDTNTTATTPTWNYQEEKKNFLLADFSHRIREPLHQPKYYVALVVLIQSIQSPLTTSFFLNSRKLLTQKKWTSQLLTL